MASSLLSSRLLAPSVRSTNSLPLLSWRCYTHPQSKVTDEYKSFRQSYTALRFNFIKDFKQEKKMLEEDYNSQAAQDARMETEREAKALAENEKEQERMAQERERRNEIWAMKMEKRRLHGVEARAKVEAELKEKRAKIVEDMIEKSKDFVTMENLEEKIIECLDNEVNYNYALSMTGEKLK